MIQPNELRIGNWIMVNVGRYKPSVDRIVREWPWKSVTIPILYEVFHVPHLFEGIPLTPELLEKCGATEGVSTPFWVLDLGGNHGQLHINVGNGMGRGIVWYMHDRLKDFAGLNLKSIIYLHQLQNTVYALTGQELEVKL